MDLVSDGAGSFVIGVFMCAGGRVEGGLNRAVGPFFISTVPGMLGSGEGKMLTRWVKSDISLPVPETEAAATAPSPEWQEVPKNKRTDEQRSDRASGFAEVLGWSDEA